QTIDHVVQAGLQDAQQVVTGHALAGSGHLVILVELALQHAVVTAGLLLLTQLHTVLGQLLGAAPVVHTRGKGPALHGALVGVAAVALQEELLALSAALAADCSGISSHNSYSSFSYTRRRLGGRQPLWGMGVTSLIRVTSRPTACRARMAASRPAP